MPTTTGAFAEKAEMLANRCAKNLRKLRRPTVGTEDAFRIYDRDIPELPFVIDVYAARLHVSEFARPGTPEGDDHAEWLDACLSATARSLQVGPERIFVKVRDRQRGSTQYGRFGTAGARFEVREGAARLWVNLGDYLDTGLFLDHKPLRLRVGGLARGLRVLNLFAYTGAFSVHAALGGAASTVTVDWSNTYLDWAEENFSLNSLSGNHRFVRDDVGAFLADDRGEYDVIVVDPPTFSNRTGASVFDVQRDHDALVRACLRRLAPNGKLFFSTNFRRFKPGSSLAPFRETSAETVPPDFRDRRIHRSFAYP